MWKRNARREVGGRRGGKNPRAAPASQPDWWTGSSAAAVVVAEPVILEAVRNGPVLKVELHAQHHAAGRRRCVVLPKRRADLVPLRIENGIVIHRGELRVIKRIVHL